MPASCAFPGGIRKKGCSLLRAAVPGPVQDSTDSMGDFCSLADLNSYLLEISPRYGKYAADLWDKNIRSPAQLANVSITHLADCGISNIAHAKTIQAYSAVHWVCCCLHSHAGLSRAVVYVLVVPKYSL
ncbi:hypothetical protein WJX79_000280 [Trebouxia sp. C0005]